MTDTTARRHALLVTLNFAAVYVLWGSTYMAICYGVHELPPALMATLVGITALYVGAAELGKAWFYRSQHHPLRPRSIPA